MIRRKGRPIIFFLAAGIPAATGTGLVHFFRFKDAFAASIVAFIGFILIGSSLSLIAYRWPRSEQKVRWGNKIFATVLVIAGITLTDAYYQIAQYVPVGHWLEIEAPPEETDHLLPSADLDIFGSYFFIQGKSGTIYSYECISYDGCLWIQTEYSRQNQTDASENSNSVLSMYFAPVPPGPIAESLLVIYSGSDYEILTNYILLTNGRLFYWNRFWNVFDVFWLLIGFTVCGYICGITTFAVEFWAGPTVDEKSFLMIKS